MSDAAHRYDVFGAVPESGDEEAYLRAVYPEYFTDEPHEGGWDECACCPLPDDDETETPHAE